jgi:monovalent cation:H+ antiporter-2, CPA2 family
MSESVLFIQDLAVILLAAAICGFGCSRIGLSPVVGYLAAGLVVGTPQITFPYVTDANRLAVIAQLGVVFLMFAIGLQFRLHKVRELGVRIVIATALTAIIILTVVRGIAGFAGLSDTAALCIAAVFMVSSSAIIGKVLDERALGHERFGQVALGITLMEDIVAVIMLAVLNSYINIEDASAARSPLTTLGMLAGFALLVWVTGLLLMPRLLRRIARNRQPEIGNLIVAGLLLALALIAVRAGYSLALGAFLFGMIVAETLFRPAIERAFKVFKDIFLTVFFVTIGMSIDLAQLPGVLHWVAIGIVGALVGRSLAAALALVVVGERLRPAVQSAVCLTPIGEFSFIIAGAAIAGGLMPPAFQATAVGIALGTSLISPLLMARSNTFTALLADGRHPTIDRLQDGYTRFWQSLGRLPGNSLLWKLLRKRFAQISIEVVLVTAIMVFSGPLFVAFAERLTDSTGIAGARLQLIFWTGLCIVCLVPVVAIWRNCAAVIMILVDYAGQQQIMHRRLLPVLDVVLRSASAVLLALWIWNLLPTGSIRRWVLWAALAGAVVMLAFVRRHVVRWHSQVEIALNEGMDAVPNAVSGRQRFHGHREAGWNLNMEEFVLPDDTVWGGRTLLDTQLRKKTGCSVVGIERHGFALNAIGPHTHLFPGDQLLLLGDARQIEAARAVLDIPTGSLSELGGQRDYILQSFVIDPANHAINQPLAALDWPRAFQVQVLALRRADRQTISPDGTTRIAAGDQLLVFGRPDRIAALADSLAHPAISQNT